MTKIAIIGAGVAGMLCAISLARRGVEVNLYERGELAFPDDQRAIAITKKSKLIMQEIGIWQDFDKLASRMNDIYVVDNKAPQMLHFAKDDIGEELGYMIEMNDLKMVLYKALEKEKLINSYANTLVEVIANTMEQVELKVSNDKNSSDQKVDLMLLCGGGLSDIKGQFFTNKVSKNYNQTVISFSVKHEKTHEGTAVEHFMPSGPFAILPHKDQHKSSIIWTEPTDLAKIYQKMSEEDFMRELELRFGEFLGKIEMNSKLYFYPLSAVITKNYYNNRIVLVGDSAHIIHPLAGQGLNQGIKDIKAICDIVSRNISVGLEVDELALQEYQNMRIHDNYLMFLVTDNINRLFSNNNCILKPIRRIGLAMLNRIVPIKKRLIKYAASD